MIMEPTIYPEWHPMIMEPTIYPEWHPMIMEPTIYPEWHPMILVICASLVIYASLVICASGETREAPGDSPELEGSRRVLEAKSSTPLSLNAKVPRKC